LTGTCKGVPAHAPGRVFTDLAVLAADGADAIIGIGVLTDREELFGPVASMPTTWRVLYRVGPEQLPTVRAARVKARAAAWAAGAGPDLGEELRLDRRGGPEGVGGHQCRPTPSALAAAVSPDHHAGLLGVGEHGRARDEPPDVTARHRVGDDAGRASATSRWRLTREPLACCSPIALPARRRRACCLRDTRFRSRWRGSRSSSGKTRLIPPGLTYADMGI
jgi:hypothetical protein